MATMETELLSLDEITPASNVTIANPCILKTKENILMFVSNMVVSNYTAGQVLATLPNDFRPNSRTTSVCFCNTTTRRLFIDPNGEISCSHPTTSGTVTIEMNGLCVNINDSYYNSSLGNNTPFHPTEEVI